MRDTFDLAVIAQHHERLLLSNLYYVKSKKSANLERLHRIKPDFYQATIEELDILREYARLAQDSLRPQETLLSTFEEAWFTD